MKEKQIRLSMLQRETTSSRDAGISSLGLDVEVTFQSAPSGTTWEDTISQEEVLDNEDTQGDMSVSFT